MNSQGRKELSSYKLRSFVEPDELELLFSQLPRYRKWEINPRAHKDGKTTNLYRKELYLQSKNELETTLPLLLTTTLNQRTAEKIYGF